MPIFFKGNRALLFIHVPKTGGTSMEKALQEAGWAMRFHTTPQQEPRVFRIRTSSPQHYHAELLRQTLHTGQFESIFMMVRDPIARFRSEYAMRVRDPDAGTADRVEAWADKEFAAYAKNHYRRDNHLRPQHEFKLPRAHVYKYEDGIPAMGADLNRRYDLGLPDEFELHMTSQKGKRLSSKDVEISPSLRKKLLKLYAGDFKKFGYAKQ